jgi:hypothetical protein
MMFAATPTDAQKAFLAAIIKIQFPVKVQTVGEAVPNDWQGASLDLQSSEACRISGICPVVS